MMGVIFDCKICDGQAGEFDEVDNESICENCQEKALRLGIKLLKSGVGL